MGNHRYDVAIVGGGPSGLAAGQYLARAGWKAALFEKDALGGQTRRVERIENYPGFPRGISGAALMRRFVRQVARWKLETRKEAIVSIASGARAFQMISDRGELRAKSVVLCPGAAFKTLGLDGEDKLLGRGVFHCAFNHAERFRGRAVAVVGGGDAAVHQALLLSRHAARVCLVHRGGALRAIPLLRRKLAECPAVRPIFNAAVSRLICRSRARKTALAGIEIESLESGKRRRLDVSALFILIGKEPPRDYGIGGKLPAGMFVAGDAKPGNFRQVAIAAGDGIRAAMECERYLQDRWKS